MLRYLIFLPFLMFLLSARSPVLSKEFENETLRVVTLANGMKLALKALPDSVEDVQFRLLALGGFNSFSNDVKVSARLAAQAAWESGLDGYTSDQLFVMMHNETIDMTSKVLPFSREVVGSCHQESVESALKLVHWLFMNVEISASSVEKIVQHTESALRNRAEDQKLAYDDIRYAINTNHHRYFKPFTIKSLRKVDPKLVEAVYRDAFGDPKEFVAVIVGNINIEEVLGYAKKFLETIHPKGKGEYVFDSPIVVPPFPKTPVKKSISGDIRRTKSMAAEYTFPVALQGKLTLKEYKLLTFCTQLLEKKIRDAFLSTKRNSFGVDVSYVIPFYPYLDAVWLDIQYLTENAYLEQEEKEIFAIFKGFRENGPTFADMEFIEEYLVSSDEFWTKENSFWVNNLSNFLLWDWSLNEVLYTFSKQNRLTRKEVQEFFQTRLSLDRYTRVITN
jgi:predicted Zn-dependent peptidase